MIQQLRYEGERLDDVLARIHDDHGDEANIISAELVRTGGVGGFFTRESYEVTVELPVELPVEDSVELSGELSGEPDPEPQPSGRDFAEVLSAMIDDRVELTEAARGLRRPTILETRDPVAPPVPMAPPAPVASIDLTSPDAVAASCQGPIGIAELFATVTRSLRPAPAIAEDGIVAIVGARGDAVEVATGLASMLGRPASDVLVVAPSEVDITPAQMAQIVRSAADRRGATGANGPTLAVVVVAPGVAGHRWATNVLASMGASQVRLAVAAWRPLDRLAETMVGLGGADVVDIVDFESAEHPEDLLGIDAAIGTIDGVESTPTQWVAALAAAGRTVPVGIGRSSMDAR